MTQESLHNYNEKLNAAREELNKVNGILNNNPTVAVIRSTTNEANNVKAALDEARTQLVLDRQPFINHINSEDSLNTPQKENYKNQINNATNHRELVNIQSNADTLNQAMKKLKESIADYEQEKLKRKLYRCFR